MRTWTRLALAVLLTTPFTLAPLRAADEPNAEKIARLQKELDGLRKDVQDLQGKVTDISLKRFKYSVDIRELQQRLDVVEKLVRNHDELVKTRITQSQASPNPGNGGAATNSTGTIYLRNQYSASATIHINGQTYTVGPGATLTVTRVPLGTITYDVSVDGYGLIQPSTPVPLTARGRTINVFPIQP